MAAVLVAAPAAQATEGCRGKDERITAANVEAAEATLLCVVNDYRRSNGLTPLTEVVSLKNAALAHSLDMVARQYFGHSTPEGSTPADRANAAGYRSFGYAENLAYSPQATPRGLLELWRASPAHHANLLARDARASGIGITPGSPAGGLPTAGVATATHMFGTHVPGGNAGRAAPDPPEDEACRLARGGRKKLERRLAGDRRRLRRARTRGGRRKYRRAVGRDSRALARVKKRQAQACVPPAPAA